MKYFKWLIIYALADLTAKVLWYKNQEIFVMLVNDKRLKHWITATGFDRVAQDILFFLAKNTVYSSPRCCVCTIWDFLTDFHVHVDIWLVACRLQRMHNDIDPCLSKNNIINLLLASACPNTKWSVVHIHRQRPFLTNIFDADLLQAILHTHNTILRVATVSWELPNITPTTTL
jgi:hypothetical protein